MNNFTRKNRAFLAGFHGAKTQGNLLVEEMSGASFINHCMSMQALFLNIAHGFRPLYLRNGCFNQDFVQSYVPEAAVVELERLSLLEKMRIGIVCFFQLLKAYLLGNILPLRYNGVIYGDIVYDVFLQENSVATLDERNWCSLKKIARIYLFIAVRHKKIKNLIRKMKIDAVLVSHKIGSCGGPLARCALKMKRKVYSNAGMHRNTLYLNSSFKNVKDYEYTPTLQEIKHIMAMPNFDDRFAEIHNEHIWGNRSLDAQHAFNDSYDRYENRELFCFRFSVDPAKKNVFVMLHAFTDHPHAHFPRMLFKDYKDWFLQTLLFAKNDNGVNWFFKRHPSDKFYPTTDVNFEELFANLPDNVKFIDTTDRFDTRNLEVVADAVITCTGSVGFEMPAMYGIPTITAGDNPYSHLQFVKYPASCEAYFFLLSNLKDIQRLAPEEQKEAKAFYMFRYSFCTVDYSFIPVLSHEDHHSPNLNAIFFEKVLALYEEKGGTIKDQIARYAFEMSRPDYKALRTKDYLPRDDYFSFPFDLMKPLPDCAFDILKEGCDTLDSLGVPYCLADGTLLGIYRDRKLIPFDRDLDIAIIHPVDASAIIRAFAERGFQIGRCVEVYGQAQQIVFYKHSVVFDILFYTRHDEVVATFSEADYYFVHPYDHYLKFDSVVYCGRLFPVPNRTEDWLCRVYGEDWRTPRTAKPADWREGGGSEYLAGIHFDGDVHGAMQKLQTSNMAG